LSVILSGAKDLKIAILRSFGVFAPQDDGSLSFVVCRSSFVVRRLTFVGLTVRRFAVCRLSFDVPREAPS
jgi:hypothetical protein